MSALARVVLGGLPLRYALRNLLVRRASSLFTALGVALTVAVFAGVLSLRLGFEQIYRPRGDVELGLYLRPSATSEGESGIRREMTDILIKERPEIARDASGRPLAAAESYLAVYMDKVGGGVTNVPLRGVQPMTLQLHGEALRLVAGRWPAWGSDEVVVGRALSERIANTAIGDTLTINLTPFRVVGVFDHPGVYGGEIWGDVERLLEALERPFFSRVIARLAPGTDVERLRAELERDRRAPVKFLTEREYLATQTQAFGGAMNALAGMITFFMGAGAVIGAIITMLAAVAARTHEIGVLLALGFRRRAIFLSFLIESALIGALGGALGVALVTPFHGVRTGAVNWNTFTDISFEFRVTPALLMTAVGLAVSLALVGGILPALRAAYLKPVAALRTL